MKNESVTRTLYAREPDNPEAMIQALYFLFWELEVKMNAIF